VTERHITQKHSVRKDEIPTIPAFHPFSLFKGRRVQNPHKTKAGWPVCQRAHPADSACGMPAKERLKPRDARIEPGRVAGIAPAHKPLAFRTKRAARRDAEPDLAHQRLA
jgi:hypothetical protein